MAKLQLPGPMAETAFRLQRLSGQLAAQCPAVRGVAVRYVHFVHTERDLSDAERAILDALLSYGSGAEFASGAGQFIVVPRLGTISPWASKATDIARICGLPVRRLERGRLYSLDLAATVSPAELQLLWPLVHDRMTESVLSDPAAEASLFAEHAPRPLRHINLLRDGSKALAEANDEFGLALSNDEIQYLAKQFQTLQRDPTDVELMMFAQANSEHCRHKVFNADWVIDGKPADRSLFEMIKNTYAHAPAGVLSAYTDNAAVIAGAATAWFFAEKRAFSGVWPSC